MKSKWWIPLPSKSKERFDERLSEISLLRGMMPPSTALKELTPSRRNLENAIRRASLVMLCVHVQGYVEDILEEFILNLRSQKAVSSKIPAELKVALCKPDLSALHNDDYNILMERIPDFIRRYETIWCSSKELPPDEFPEFDKKDWETGNPWANTIDSYMKRIGIRGFWSEKNRIIKGDLDNLVVKRNLIAHGHLHATATDEDVTKYIESAKSLVELLDEQIEYHLNNITER